MLGADDRCWRFWICLPRATGNPRLSAILLFLPNRDRLATRQPESHLDDLRASVTAMIWKFADAAAQAGIDLDNLITILESGVPIQAVLDLIQAMSINEGSRAPNKTTTSSDRILPKTMNGRKAIVCPEFFNTFRCYWAGDTLPRLVKRTGLSPAHRVPRVTSCCAVPELEQKNRCENIPTERMLKCTKQRVRSRFLRIGSAKPYPFPPLE
jgi:hypothetical protein